MHAVNPRTRECQQTPVPDTRMSQQTPVTDTRLSQQTPVMYTAFKFRYAVPENVIFTEHLALKRVGSFCHVLAFLPKNFLATLGP